MCIYYIVLTFIQNMLIFLSKFTFIQNMLISFTKFNFYSKYIDLIYNILLIFIQKKDNLLYNIYLYPKILS